MVNPRPMIPGAYDRSNLTYRQPGSMGGAGNGSPEVAGAPSSMDTATTADRHSEGGGLRRKPGVRTAIHGEGR